MMVFRFDGLFQMYVVLRQRWINVCHIVRRTNWQPHQQGMPR